MINKQGLCCTVDLSVFDVSPDKAPHPHETHRYSDNMHHAVTNTKHQTAQGQCYRDGDTTEQLKATLN
jgi:hypothetical protein